MGPSGIGKSRLLAAAGAIAADMTVDVLTACGGELERDYPFGLVRRLFEGRIARASVDERSELFRGHAALAESILRPWVGASGPQPTDEFHLMHGLYWLVTNLADGADLVLIADDLQWADDLSLRFLLYLAQRLGDLPVTIIGAVRTGDPLRNRPRRASAVTGRRNSASQRTVAGRGEADARGGGAERRR